MFVVCVDWWEVLKLTIDHLYYGSREFVGQTRGGASAAARPDYLNGRKDLLWDDQ